MPIPLPLPMPLPIPTVTATTTASSTTNTTSFTTTFCSSDGIFYVSWRSMSTLKQVCLNLCMLRATLFTRIYKTPLCNVGIPDAKERSIIHRQYIQEVKAWINHHWLLRYPLKCAPSGTAGAPVIYIIISKASILNVIGLPLISINVT